MNTIGNVEKTNQTSPSAYNGPSAGRLLKPDADGIIKGGQKNNKKEDSNQTISNIRYSRLKNGGERLVLDVSRNICLTPEVGPKVNQANAFNVKYDPRLKRVSLLIMDNRDMKANLKKLNSELKESKDTLIESVRVNMPAGTYKTELIINTGGYGEENAPKLNVYEFEKPGRIVLDFLPGSDNIPAQVVDQMKATDRILTQHRSKILNDAGGI